MKLETQLPSRKIDVSCMNDGFYLQKKPFNVNINLGSDNGRKVSRETKRESNIFYRLRILFLLLKHYILYLKKHKINLEKYLEKIFQL